MNMFTSIFSSFFMISMFFATYHCAQTPDNSFSAENSRHVTYADIKAVIYRRRNGPRLEFPINPHTLKSTKLLREASLPYTAILAVDNTVPTKIDEPVSAEIESPFSAKTESQLPVVTDDFLTRQATPEHLVFQYLIAMFLLLSTLIMSQQAKP